MNYSPGNIDIVIFVYVCSTSMKIVSPGYHFVTARGNIHYCTSMTFVVF